MATIAQASPSMLQPVITALTNVVNALNVFAAANGVQPLSVETSVGAQTVVANQGVLASFYPQYIQMYNNLQILLANLRQGQQLASVQVNSGSLYEVAATEYGDALQAFNLMEVDGFCTPWIANNVIVNVNLPPSATISPAQGFSPSQVNPLNPLSAE